MDAEFGKWLGTLGVGGAIAGVLAYFYHRLAQGHEKVNGEMASRFETLAEDLRLVVRENTVAFTKALEMIGMMQKQLDRWDGVERRERRGPRVSGG